MRLLHPAVPPGSTLVERGASAAQGAADEVWRRHPLATRRRSSPFWHWRNRA